MTTHGGKRDGAGRPPGTAKGRTGATTAVYLSTADRTALRAVQHPGESRSAAITAAIRLLVAARQAETQPRPRKAHRARVAHNPSPAVSGEE